MADVSREIKTTLALDGEKAFNSSMAEAARNMKVLGSEMKLNTAEFRQSGSSLESLTDKQKTLGNMQDQQKKIVESLTKAVADSAEAYGESDKRTDAYRVKLNNAKAELVGIEGQLDRTGKQIDNFGKETEDAGKKTIDWKATLEELDKQLEKGVQVVGAALGAIAAFSAAVLAAGKQVWDATVDMGKFADGLLTTSEQTGISTTALQEYAYAAQFIDTEVDTITKSIAKMTKGLLDAKDGTGKNAEAFATLGVSLTDTNGQLLGSEEIFFSAIDALGKVGNETERDALAMQLFGKSALELNPLINAGSEAFKALGQEAQTMGLIVAEDTVQQFGAFDDSMNVMNSKIQSVKNSFITAMLPAMEKIQAVVQKLVEKFNDWLKSDGAQALLASLTDKVMNLVDGLSGDLEPIINKVIGSFNTIIEVIGWTIDNIGLLKTIVIGLTTLLVALKVAQLASTLAQLGMNTAMLANPIGIVIIAIAAIIASIVVLVKNWDNVKEAFVKAWETIKNAWNECGAFFAGIWDGIKNAFAGAFTWLKDLGINMVKGLWEGIKNSANWLSENITNWIGDIWSGIKGFFGIKSPSKLMADTIGKPMAQGMALGFKNNLGLVTDALGVLDPMLNMGVTARAEQSVTANFSDTALAKIVTGLADAMMQRDDMTIVLNDREFGRAVRKVSMA